MLDNILIPLHRLRNTIRLSRVDGLASLLDLLQNGRVVQVLLGGDGSGLAFERNVEVLDAWRRKDVLVGESCSWLQKAVAIADCLLGCCGLGLTIELLQHALHGAGAAAAGHGDVELVVVFGHFAGCCEVTEIVGRVRYVVGM